jgi:hypothetical protein
MLGIYKPLHRHRAPRLRGASALADTTLVLWIQAIALAGLLSIKNDGAGDV